MGERTPFTEDRISSFVERILDIRQEAEFETFWLGVSVKGRPYKDTTEEEKAARRDFNRRAALRALELLPGLDTTARGFEALLTFHIPSGKVTLFQAPEYVYGRYLKFVRDIPQTKWPCRRCEGPGCPRCGGSGKIYPTSVEEMIAEQALAAFGAEGATLLAVGREDIDARHLGRGRPFALQLRQPLRRSVDLAALERLINETRRGKIAALGLRRADAALVAAVKAAQPDKSYRALCQAEGDVDPSALAALGRMRDVTLEQRTPTRVLSRRKDMTRLRSVRCIETIPGDAPNAFEMRLTVQSGTYVKEFISSDGGRTRPSVSEMLRVACRCVALDVTDVAWEPQAGRSE